MSGPVTDVLIRCPGKEHHVIGEWVAPDVVMVKKAGRIVIGPTPTSITCECGQTWRREEQHGQTGRDRRAF